MRRRGICFLALAGLFGCGHEGKVAGGGSDVPNKIEAVGRILTETGTLAAGVEVVSWSGEWDPEYSNATGEAVDSSVTDTVGKWSLKVPDSGAWYVTARTPGFRAISRRGQSEARLQPEASVRGTVRVNKDITLESVWVGGTGSVFPIRWQSDSSATFEQTMLPGGARLWGKVRWKGGVDTLLLSERVFLPGDNPELTLEPDTANTLLASAEAHPIGSALRGLDFDAHDVDAAKWFTTTDEDRGGGSTVSPSGFPDVDSAVKTDSFGRYFSWTLNWGPNIRYPNGRTVHAWAGVGVRLSKRDLDWSGVRALRVWIKGSSDVTRNDAKIWLQLNSSAIDRIGGEGQFRARIALPTGWSHMNVPIEAFAPPPGSRTDSLKYTWDRVKHSIHDVAFYADSSDVTLDLKEIRALGNRPHSW